MNRPVGKYILLVEIDGGPLFDLTPHLKSLGFTVLCAATPKAALSLLDATPLLSLVAVDDGLGVEDGAALVDAIKLRQPELPVLWVSSNKSTPPLSSREHPPDVVLHHPIGPDDLEDAADRLLQARFYPDPITEFLGTACIEVMKEAYDTTLTLEGVGIRATGNALASVNALLPFCGARVAGSLLVSAEFEHLAQIRQRFLPGQSNPSREEIEDVAGEYANVLAGRAKALFARYELPFDLGTPIILAGTEINVRSRASRPSLVLILRDGPAVIHVLCTFHLFDTAKVSDWTLEDDPDIAASGELRFL